MDQNVSNKSLRQYNGMLYKYLIHFYIFIILTRFIIVNSFNFRNKRALRIRCSESMRTIRKVQSCPTNKESWEESARLMDCGKIQQNCSVSPLVYHCLLDQYGKGLMEVCSLTTEIIGRRCPEFNSGAMFVQEHLEEKCKQCPFAYNSNEGYLYDECLEVEEALTTTQSTTEKHTTSPLESSSLILENNTLTNEDLEGNEKNLIIWMIVPFLLIVFMMLVLFKLLKLKKKKSKKGSMHSSERMPLIEKNTKTSVKDVIQNWKEDDSHFFESNYFPAIMHKVQKHNYLTFVSYQGSGKSSTIRHIALKLQEEGYEVLPLQDIRNLHTQFHDLHNPQVFIIDDVIGVFGLNRLKLNYLLQCEQKIMNLCCKKTKVLMSCRQELFDKCSTSFFTNEQHVIRLHSSEVTLSDDDKKGLLENYAIDKNLLSPSFLRKSSNLFPLLCKLYSKEEKFTANGELFFHRPLQLIFGNLDNMRNKNKLCYATLVLCMLNCKEFSSEVLGNEANKDFQEMKSRVLKMCKTDRDTKTRNFVDSISEMDGIYTKQCGKEFAIMHDLLFEIIAYHFGSQFPKLILKYSSSSYVANNVKVTSQRNSKKERTSEIPDASTDERSEWFDLRIRLPSKYYPLLAKRMYKDIKKGELHDVFTNDDLKHPEVCQAFLKVLQKKTYEEIKFLFLSEWDGDFKLVIQGVHADRNGREIEDRCAEWRRQQMIAQRKLIGDKFEYSVRRISWVVFFGHNQILRYIVKATKQHNETESVLFPECIKESKMDSLETRNFSKEIDNIPENEHVSFDETREKKIYDTNERETNTANSTIANEKTRILILGCYSGDLETVKILIKHVDNDLVNTPVQFYNDISDSWYWDTPLTAACDTGKINIVEELLQIGANVNQEGKFVTPLVAACQGGYKDILEKLLESKADVNLSGKYDTPLTAACRGGIVNVMKILLKNGANVNQQGQFDTPLTAACKNGHLDLVLELLNAGADVNLPDNMKETPLTAANKGGHDNLVLELKKIGADTFLSNGPYNNEDDTISKQMTECVVLR